MKHVKTYENYSINEGEQYWLSPVSDKDDFGDTIEDVIIDDKTKHGPWALMTPASFDENGIKLGLGWGQKYQKQEDGKWLKIDG